VLVAEAGTAAGHVAHLVKALLERLHDAPALAGADAGEADAELLALAGPAGLLGGRLVDRLHREAAVAADREVGLEAAALAGAVVDVDLLAADLVAVAEEEDVDGLAGDEGGDRPLDRHLAEDLRLAAVQMADV